MLYFVSSFLSIFLNSKNNVVRNLKTPILDNKSISFYLIVDLLSLSFSSGLQEFKNLTL